MAQFDPYRKWLGIPPEEQLPNHYRLLGIGLFESDADVICNAADRQMAHVRTFQTGRYSALSQKLLNELSVARVSLLDAKKRAAYDAELRGRLGTNRPAQVLPVAVSAPPVAIPIPSYDNSHVADADPIAQFRFPASPRSTTSHVVRRRKSSLPGPIIGAAVGMIFLGVVIWLVARSGNETPWGLSGNSTTQRGGDETRGSPISNGASRPHSEPSAKPQPRPADVKPKTTPAATEHSPAAETKPDAAADQKLEDHPKPPVELADERPATEEEPDDAPVDEPTASNPEQPAPSVARIDPPDEDAVRKAEDLIRNEVFKAEFEAADRPTRRAALAQKLLRESRKPQDDHTAEYAFLKVARDEAAAAGDLETALAAMDALDSQYNIANPSAARCDTLEALARSPAAATVPKAIIDRMFAAIDAAVDADEFAAAERLFAAARSVASKGRDPVMLKSLGARGKRLQASKQEFAAVAEAQETLKANAGDPQANGVVGKYYCLVKGDWKRGLPALAAGDDETLKQLAQRDLALPSTPGDRVALADGWWELAEKQTGPAREQLRSRAVTWYKAAVNNLQGLDRTKAKQRISETDVMGSLGEGAGGELPKLGSIECREMAVRDSLLKRFGGNEASEAAVERALVWLDKHQNPDGSWNFNHQGPRCKRLCPDPGKLESAPNAATALALLPLLGAGNGPKEGKYRKNVNLGVKYLTAYMVRAGGTLYEPKAQGMPSHALGTIALCEASAMTRDRPLHATAQAAVNFVIGTQNSDGGWSDKPNLPDSQRKDKGEQKPEPSTMSATGWNVIALRTAQWTGLQVPEKNLQQANAFLDKMYVEEKAKEPDKFDKDKMVEKIKAVGYRRDHSGEKPDPQATATALCLRLCLGWSRDRKEFGEYAAGLDTPVAGRLVQNYFLSETLRQTEVAAWPKWNASLRDQLVAAQAKEGHAAGSWFYGSDWTNEQGGRLFCTALSALILEVYYRHPPPL